MTNLLIVAAGVVNTTGLTIAGSLFGGPAGGLTGLSTGIGLTWGEIKLIQKCRECRAKALSSAQETARSLANELLASKVDNLSKIINAQLSAMNDSIHYPCEETGKLVKSLNLLISTINGAALLSSGQAISYNLWSMGLNCNPMCDNANAELARIASIALSAAGISLLIFSGMKSAIATCRN